jgi:hypothetical protein
VCCCVVAYSSADRPSETPQNTLKPSRCWREMNRYKHREALTSLQEFYDVPTFVMTLGERIQRRCGCSSGSSCYWSRYVFYGDLSFSGYHN